jgi:phosphatidylserine/phosphatidylglycerophosphate/cardiolipin synthase-like enzyme
MVLTMTNIDYMYPQIVYDTLLMTTYKECIKKTGRSFINIISPWVREINFSSLSLGNGIKRVLANISNENLSSIRSILLCYLSLRNPTLRIITQNYMLDSPAIEKKDRFYNIEEIRLLRTLAAKGAHIYLHNDLHAKMILTSTAALTGSANVTNLGMFGHTESVSYFDISDKGNYNANITKGSLIVQEASELDAIGLFEIEKRM